MSLRIITTRLSAVSRTECNLVHVCWWARACGILHIEFLPASSGGTPGPEGSDAASPRLASPEDARPPPSCIFVRPRGRARDSVSYCTHGVEGGLTLTLEPSWPVVQINQPMCPRRSLAGLAPCGLLDIHLIRQAPFRGLPAMPPPHCSRQWSSSLPTSSSLRAARAAALIYERASFCRHVPRCMMSKSKMQLSRS
jgi:hypothetical protein